MAEQVFAYFISRGLWVKITRWEVGAVKGGHPRETQLSLKAQRTIRQSALPQVTDSQIEPVRHFGAGARL